MPFTKVSNTWGRSRELYSLKEYFPRNKAQSYRSALSNIAYIGNFVLPFVQAFFPGMGVAYLCMFDVGNALMGLGGTFAIASSVVSSEQKLSVSNVIKKLFSSIPFDVYIVIFFLALFKIKIPAPILSITDFIGAGNGFLAMLKRK